MSADITFIAEKDMRRQKFSYRKNVQKNFQKFIKSILEIRENFVLQCFRFYQNMQFMMEKEEKTSLTCFLLSESDTKLALFVIIV